MSTNQPTKETSRKGTKPAFTAYHVQDAVDEGSKANWTKIGVYFAHEDGQGGTVKLDVPSTSTAASSCAPRKPSRRGVHMKLLTKAIHEL